MSNKQQQGRQKGRGTRRISVRAVRRDQPDVHKLSRALIKLAMEQAAAEAAAQQEVGRHDREAADG
ncbi:hypothetical protein [Geodermatophilus sp. SYSU D01119]